MSDEWKEWLLKHVNYVFNECRRYIESKNNDCLNCLEGADTCYQAHEEIKRLIQQRPAIDKKYVEGKAEDLVEMTRYDGMTAIKSTTAEKFITQIVSDVRGGGKDGSK